MMSDPAHVTTCRPLAAHRGLPRVCRIIGGLPESGGPHAVAGAHRWQKFDDESAMQFHDRVVIAATASREPLLVIVEVP